MALDLTAIAKNAAAVGMRVAGNALKTATVHMKQTGGDYDPATDTTVQVESNVTVEGLRYDFAQVQGVGVSTYSTGFLIEGAAVPAAIDEADQVTLDGRRWEVVEVKRIPTEAVVILGLR